MSYSMRKVCAGWNSTTWRSNLPPHPRSAIPLTLSPNCRVHVSYYPSASHHTFHPSPRLLGLTLIPFPSSFYTPICQNKYLICNPHSCCLSFRLYSPLINRFLAYPPVISQLPSRYPQASKTLSSSQIVA